MNHRLDIPTLQGRPRHSPEDRTIVAAYAHRHYQLGEGAESLPHIAETQFSGRRNLDPVWISVFLVVVEPAVDGFGCKGRMPGALPHGDDLLVRELEVNIRLASLL